MVYFEPWDWIIPASSYQEEFRELVRVDDFKESILSISLGKSGYPYVIDTKGNIVIHPKLAAGTNVYNSTDSEGRKFVQEICEKKFGKITYTWKNPDERSHREKQVVFSSIDDMDWIVISSIYVDESYAPIRNISYIIGATMAITLVFIFALTWWSSSAIIRPLKELMLQFDSGANGDFSGRVAIRSEDEIGRLAGYYNTFMLRLQEYNDQLVFAKNAAEGANQAKSDFLMNMSHELRTPLNGVVAASELISMSETDAELKGIQDIIQSSSTSLLQTVEHILDFTKSKDGELELSSEPFMLHEVLGKINTSFFQKGSHLLLKPEFDFKPDDVPNAFIGDEGRLIEILNHLLENAAKFTQKTPEATIGIKALEKSPENVVLEFSITDSGIGIAREHFEMIFEPFSQADTSSTRQYDGVGIGLSICKQFVELMGGKIWVESEPGKGSTFYLTLSLKPQKSDEYLSIQALQESTENDFPASGQKETLIEADIAALAPVIKNLYEALLESEPQEISTYLAEIKTYEIPKRLELINRIDDYEYDTAAVLVKEIAAELGLLME